MALLPAWSLPFLDIAQQYHEYDATAKAVRSGITKADGEHTCLDNPASTAVQEEMRYVSSDSELKEDLKQNKDMELNTGSTAVQEKMREASSDSDLRQHLKQNKEVELNPRSHACNNENVHGEELCHGCTSLNKSECDDNTDKVTRDEDTEAKVLSRGVNIVSGVEVCSTELQEYECVQAAEILVVSVVGALNDVADEDKDGLYLQQQGQIHNTLAEAKIRVAGVSSPDLHNAESKRKYSQTSHHTDSLQVVPEAESDIHKTETSSQDECENNGEGTIHTSQRKVEHHLESSPHRPNLSNVRIQRKAQEEKVEEDFPVPPAGSPAKYRFLQSDNMEFQQVLSCGVLVSNISRDVSAQEHMVPDDTSPCLVGRSGDLVSEDQCFYNETPKKSSHAAEHKSPSNFKWKYRPSFEETDETLTCLVEDDARFTLGTVRPLPTFSGMRSLRLGLSRNQKIRRLHTFKQE